MDRGLDEDLAAAAAGHQDHCQNASVAALRSRRLETLLGARLDQLTPEHIASLVGNGVAEDFDLDFKRQLYGSGESDKKALASDVAAMANTAGGLIIIGVEEDGQARATAAHGVEISDGETGRMRQIVAAGVSPLPTFDIIPVRTVDDAAAGYYVIAVPRSPGAPHAVLINYALRFPRRNGSTTYYLTEPEVAAAYRDRQAGVARQLDRAKDVEEEAAAGMDRDARAWVLTSLVPDLPGDMAVTTAAFRQFEAETVGKAVVAIAGENLQFMRARVGRRRFVATGSNSDSPLAHWASMELHADGAGTFAVELVDLFDPRMTITGTDEGSKRRWLSDEAITIGVLSGVLRLARHARDRAASGGNALVRARLLLPIESNPIEIGHTRAHGFPETRSRIAIQGKLPSAESVASLDEIADPGPALVSVTARLGDELGQSFGVTELGQLSPSGEVRRKYWGGGRQTQIVAWANGCGVVVTDDVLG